MVFSCGMIFQVDLFDPAFVHVGDASVSRCKVV